MLVSGGWSPDFWTSAVKFPYGCPTFQDPDFDLSAFFYCSLLFYLFNWSYEWVDICNSWSSDVVHPYQFFHACRGRFLEWNRYNRSSTQLPAHFVKDILVVNPTEEKKGTVHKGAHTLLQCGALASLWHLTQCHLHLWESFKIESLHCHYSYWICSVYNFESVEVEKLDHDTSAIDQKLATLNFGSLFHMTRILKQFYFVTASFLLIICFA